MTVRVQKAVRTLIEALPYIQRFPGTTMVVKYGGGMASAQLRAEFAADIVLLKLMGMNPVVVHGGGPEVSRQMERLGLEVASSTACGSPTRRPWRSCAWSSPARSTRRSWA